MKKLLFFIVALLFANESFAQWQDTPMHGIGPRTRGMINELRTTAQETDIFDYSLDTFADLWVCGGDTDLVGGIKLSQQDFILDSLNLKSTFGAGDTVIVNTYKVDNAGSETLISGPDTLVSATASLQTIDLTSTATLANRKINATENEGVAIHLNEAGTILSAALFIHRSYYFTRD